MTTICRFTAKVSKTTDKKKLKNNYESYSYGTISIRSSKLSNYIGNEVIVTVSSRKKETQPHQKGIR